MPSGFATSFGAMLLGVLMSSILFGIANLQVYIYFKTYTNDPLWTKISVCALWIVDALCVSFSFYLIYQYLITDYTNPEALLVIDWNFKAQDILSSICISFVQTLYVHRIWILDASINRDSRIRRFLPGIASISVCAGYAASLVLSHEITAPANATPNGLLGHQWITYYPLSVYPGIDAVIAASLCFLLRISRTGYRRTDSLINTLMLYTVNTGIITSLCSLAAIIAMKISPRTFIVAAVEFLLPRVYVNSYIAMLNARNSLRGSDFRMTRDYVLNTLQHAVTPEVTDDSKPPALPQTINIQSDIDNDSGGPRSSYTDVESEKKIIKCYAPPTFPQGERNEGVMISLSKEHASSPGPLPTPPQAHVYAIHNTARSMLRYGQTLRESKNKDDRWEDSTASNV